MILDLAGGILSLAQLALEAVVLRDSSIITGKLLLLAEGLVYLEGHSNSAPEMKTVTSAGRRL